VKRGIASIRSNLAFLTAAITKLEASRISLHDSVAIVKSIQEQLKIVSEKKEIKCEGSGLLYCGDIQALLTGIIVKNCGWRSRNS
jgi:hypothetical protein